MPTEELPKKIQNTRSNPTMCAVHTVSQIVPQNNDHQKMSETKNCTYSRIYKCSTHLLRSEYFSLFSPESDFEEGEDNMEEN